VRLLFAALHVSEQFDDFLRLVIGGPIMKLGNLFDLAGSHLFKQLFWLLPRDNHAGIGSRCLLLLAPGLLLLTSNHLSVLTLDLVIECILHVLSLVEIVLVLLLAPLKHRALLTSVNLPEFVLLS
jgi:hypothetical protein